MLKKVYGHKLSRNSNSRKALFRGLISSLIEKEKIETTKVKAKAIQRDVDKLFTMARRGDEASRRLALARMGNDTKAVNKLFGSLKDMTTKRQSGFTRITNLPNRKGDNAPVVRMELVK